MEGERGANFPPPNIVYFCVFSTFYLLSGWQPGNIFHWMADVTFGNCSPLINVFHTKSRSVLLIALAVLPFVSLYEVRYTKTRNTVINSKIKSVCVFKKLFPKCKPTNVFVWNWKTCLCVLYTLYKIKSNIIFIMYSLQNAICCV